MSVHILMYPYPTSGHIIPLLDLAHKLLHLRRRSDLAVSVTVLVTPDNLHLLDPFLSSSPPPSSSSLQPLVLPSPEPPATPHPPQRGLAASVRGLHLPLLSRWFESHPSPPCAVVSDFFLGWTHRFTRERRVPRVVFSPWNLEVEDVE